MSRIRPRSDTLRPQITRSRTGSFSALQNSQINISSETARNSSVDHKEAFSSNLLSNLLKLNQRSSSVFKENIKHSDQPTPKESFLAKKERLKRPLRTLLAPSLPRPNIYIAPVQNSFYEYLDKMEPLLHDMDEMKRHISIPHNFF
ncbi:unnamed protein product [Blepharisma stoltei]|uniref:Uncharacterized protein n=1 Tax=Blepharisma stoltei TaxID=1481888 RepID=A0AAU9ICY4_9CILI|nr:unnamed protein product [Blepharisma stoltei]